MEARLPKGGAATTPGISPRDRDRRSNLLTEAGVCDTTYL